MRAPLLLATALSGTMTAFAPAHALAQDAAAFDWSGFYAGAVAGAATVTGGVNLLYPAPGAAVPATGYHFDGNALLGNSVDEIGLPTLFAIDNAGSVVGMDAGYNQQVGHFVFGLEGDLSHLTNRAHAAATSDSGLTTVTADASLDALLTLRARAGVAVDRLMFFATAGLAVGHTTLGTDLNYSDMGKSAFAHGSALGLASGVVIGGGAEYAVNDNVSIKAEGLYYRLPGQTVTATGSGVNSGSVGFQPYAAKTDDPTGFMARVGINFHF
jgi:outer membrane immunogenic protein